MSRYYPRTPHQTAQQSKDTAFKNALWLELSKGILWDIPMKRTLSITDGHIHITISGYGQYWSESFEADDPQSFDKANSWLRETYMFLKTLQERNG